MAENGSRKRGSRRAYLRDFKPDENGNYTYSGRIYRNTSGPDVLRRRLMMAIGVFSVAFVLEIAAGFLPGTGMEGHILMLLPYALKAGGQESDAQNTGNHESSAQAACLREYVYGATVNKLPGYMVAVQIFAATALVDAAVCMIRGTYGMRVAPAIIFLLSQMILFAAGAWALRKNPAGEWN